VLSGDAICLPRRVRRLPERGRLEAFRATRAAVRGSSATWHGKFQDVTEGGRLPVSTRRRRVLFFRVDNDGYLDLFLTNTAEWTTSTYARSPGIFMGKVPTRRCPRLIPGVHRL